jgi:hypothetical protein
MELEGVIEQMNFRLKYTAQNGEKRLIYNDERHMIGLNGDVYENYGSKEKPMWEVVFDAWEPPIIQMNTECVDKNKKKIYDGDIINYRGQIGTVEYFAGRFIVSWNDQTDDTLGNLMIDDIEIIGNNL